MSRKETESKLPEDKDLDSGFLSGPIDYVPGDEDSGHSGETLDRTKSSSKSKTTKMSRKNTETILPDYTTEDSGIISGPIDLLTGDSTHMSEEMSSGTVLSAKHKIRGIILTNASEDSGFKSGPHDLTPKVEVAECLLQDYKGGEKVPSDCNLMRDLTQNLGKVTIVEPTRGPVTDDVVKGLPPLDVLFGQDEDGDTQLHIAAVHGAEKAVSVLIKVCPNKEWFNIPNDEGMTPLHLAALSGNPIVTRMLVLAGASITVRDKQGETPIHKATILKNTECIKALLTPVPEFPQQKFSKVVDQRNYNGQACVHLAASAGHIETLQTLVFYGADINSTENLAGWTALHIAAVRGDAALAGALRAWRAATRACSPPGRRTTTLTTPTPAPRTNPTRCMMIWRRAFLVRLKWRWPRESPSEGAAGPPLQPPPRPALTQVLPPAPRQATVPLRILITNPSSCSPRPKWTLVGGEES